MGNSPLLTYHVIANFMITEQPGTPGRNGNYEQNDDAPAGDGAASAATSASPQVINIINPGGRRYRGR